ncbi:MAG: hypothetical protein ABI210_13980 [Abditibacteriaceae bacterium]
MDYFFDGSSEALEKIISQAVRAALNSDTPKPKASEIIPQKVLSIAPLASILVAVCCSDCLTDDVKSELQQIEQEQIKIQIAEADELDESINLHDLIAPHKVTFFPALSENFIAKATAGIFDRPLARILLQAIKQGKPVIAIAPAVSSNLRANSPALFRLQQAHRQRLEQFGVRLIAQKDISKVLLSALPKSTFKDAAPQIHSSNKQLLTAEDIEKAAKEGKSKLQVSYRSIITPLARDRAKDLNITIDLKG